MCCRGIRRRTMTYFCSDMFSRITRSQAWPQLKTRYGRQLLGELKTRSFWIKSRRLEKLHTRTSSGDSPLLDIRVTCMGMSPSGL